MQESTDKREILQRGASTTSWFIGELSLGFENPLEAFDARPWDYRVSRIVRSPAPVNTLFADQINFLKAVSARNAEWVPLE